SSDFKSQSTQGTTFNKGLFESKSSFTNVAYVRVLTGKTPLAQFPVPLVDDRTLVVRMSPNADAIKGSGIELRRELWESALLHSLNQANLRIGELYTAKSLEAQLRQGRHHEQAIAADSARFAAERIKLLELGNQNKIKVDLSTGDQRAVALTKRLEQL